MTDDELVTEIEAQRSLKVAVATGGPRIQQVNAQYIERRDRIAGGRRLESCLNAGDAVCQGRA